MKRIICLLVMVALVCSSSVEPHWVGDRYYKGDGSFATGWTRIGADQVWYYFDPATGKKVTNKWIGSDASGWYYLMNNGQMAVSTWVGDYYVNKNGKWVPNYGKSVEGWKHNGKGYWYDNGVGGWYTGWHYITAGPNGAAPGWYYFNDAGYMARNVWVGEYYVGNDGVMYASKNAQIAGTWYSFDADGRVYAKAKSENDLWATTNDNHAYEQLLTRDGSEGTSLRHYNYDGTLKKNAWEGDYYLGPQGKMLTNQWVGEYYVGADGKWVP